MPVDPNLIYPGKDLTNVFPEEGEAMTYQELLVEFTSRRAAIDADLKKKANLREEINLLLWAMQALIEKLRDEREGPQP